MNKICSMCNKEKDLSEFYSQDKFSKHKGNYIYYNPECKECSKKKAKKWASKNPEAVKASKRKYNNTEIGKSKIRESTKERRRSGKYKEWQKNNSDKLNEYSKNHRNHAISNNEWELCKKYFDYSCAYCGLSEEEHRKLYNQQLHKEHVLHDGRNDIKNCIPSCKMCNSSKHIATLNQWYNIKNPNYTRCRYLRIYKWIRFDAKKISEQKVKLKLIK